MKKLLAIVLAAALTGMAATAQIVNRLKVDDDTFQRYAWGRMQMYSQDNLALADSLYQAGVRSGNFRYCCLGLALEFPVRFAMGDYDRMTEAVQEIKSHLRSRPDCRAFYFQVIHEYCQYLLYADRAPDAMLEARDMERLASRSKNALGKLYSRRILGLIQSYRSNSWLAIQNWTKAAGYCKEAKAEHELPDLLVLIAQEHVRLGEFDKADEFCRQAEAYLQFFPSLRIKTMLTRAFLYYAEGDLDRFREYYDRLTSDPLYKMQTKDDERHTLGVAFLRSSGLFAEALAEADSLSTARDRHNLRHGIFAETGDYAAAYSELSSLMSEKDSIYIKVQNEDLAILDAEMENARLRQEAARLKARGDITILAGFMVLFALAFAFIIVSQWQQRKSLDEMKRRNAQILMARRAHLSELNAKEAENAIKIKILQNRKSNTFKL